jgi:hypothetical protein
MEIRLFFQNLEVRGTTILQGDTVILNRNKGFIIHKDETINVDPKDVVEIILFSNQVLPDDLEV